MSALVASGALPHGAEAMAVDTPAAAARLRTFHTLDALRGVAAVTIVLFHVAFIYGLAAPAEGQVAVDLFFVMSGFIIAHRYEHDFARGLSLGRFVKLRLIRLYPLFLLGTVMGLIPALLAVLTGHADAPHEALLKSFPLAILMLPSRFALPQIQELYPLNYVAWSLALEIVINIVYAATYRAWTIRNLVLFLVAAFIGLCACAVFYHRLKYGYAWPQVPVGFVRIVYGFGMGVLIHRLYERGLIQVSVPWWALIAVALVIFFLPVEWGRPAWEVFIVAAVTPAIVAAAIVNEPPKGLRGTCAVAGIGSYLVYSLHAPFVGFFLRGEDRLHLDLRVQSHAEAAAFTLLLVALCVAAHVLYDKPVRRMLTRWSQRRDAGAFDAPGKKLRMFG